MRGRTGAARPGASGGAGGSATLGGSGFPAVERAAAGLMRGVDEFFTQRALVSPRKDALTPAQRLAEGERFLASLPEGFGDDVDAFFPEGFRDGFRRRIVRPLRDGHVVDLLAESRHRCVLPGQQAAFDENRPSQTVVARHFRHQRRFRPAVVLIHGFMAGDLLVEELEWPTHAYYARGVDVVLAVLPGHGPRKLGPRLGPPDWPGRSPAYTIEGYRQAVGELRGLVSRLLEDGASSVSVMGMSLGGYMTALLATAEPRLSLVAPFIPFASTADFMRDNGQLDGTADEVAAQHRMVEAIFRPVSPFRGPCLAPAEGRLVYAGRHDRVTPPAHADRIAAHFGVETTLFPGAHILQYGRTQAWRGVLRNLRSRGLLAS